MRMNQTGQLESNRSKRAPRRMVRFLSCHYRPCLACVMMLALLWPAIATPIANSVNRDTTTRSRPHSNAKTARQTPDPALVEVTPTRAVQGQSLNVTLRGRNTRWATGLTRATFGSEVSVSGAGFGEAGLLQVTSPTTATAQLTISATATLAPRTVRVATTIKGSPVEEAVTLNDGFTIAPVTAPGAAACNVTTFAGSIDGVPGFADGDLAQARFRNPAGIATGPDDVIIIADSGNHRIRAINLLSQLPGATLPTVTTRAGDGKPGFADGGPGKAHFNNPQGVAVDANGVVFVADTDNHRIRRIAADGTVSTVAGDGTPGLRDGTATQARFNAPSGIAVDRQGNLYVADTGNSAVRVISPGGEVKTLAGDGTAGAEDSPRPRFNSPVGIIADHRSGYLYLSDTGNHRLRRLEPSGSVITLAGTDRGFADGTASHARFADPAFVALDLDGKLVIADSSNALVRAVDPDLALNGAPSAITTLAGTGERGLANGGGNLARFAAPNGVAVMGSGAIIVADSNNHVLRRLALPPAITSILPAQALPLATVTLNGTGFDARSTERNIVRFKAGSSQVVANITATTRTQLTLVVPPQATTGPVTVQTETGSASSPTNFEVINSAPPAPPRPVINSFTPSAGPPGTLVRLLGFALSSDRGAPVVTFTGATAPVPAPVVFESATEVRVTVPEGAVTGPIRLTNSFGSAVTNGAFTVQPSPPGFNVTVTPPLATTVEHSTAVYVVYITSSQMTFTQLAALATTGLPAGVSAVFDPPQITAGANSTLTVNLASASLTPGNYSFTINATATVNGSPLTRTASATLAVIAAGQTTLSGRVLSIEKEPIPGATVSLDGKTATTDSAGAFLLAGVTAGTARPVMIDGRTASVPNRTYPVITEPATIAAGQANAVPFTFYLPPIDTQYESVIVPTQDTTATNPRLAGLTMTVPANANLRNRDGSPVARVSITPLEIDRTPAPLPTNIRTAMVYTSQPGGAMADLAMPVVYPNLSGANPNTRVELYAFNHDSVQWYIYGYGRVSADGRTVAPEIDPSTNRPYGLRDFSWHFFAPPPLASPNGDPSDPSGCPPNRGTSPVDYSTGIKIEEATDISFGGARGTISLTRTYTSDRAVSNTLGPFGLGTTHNYDVRLTGTFQVGGAGRVVMPEQVTGRLFSYTRTDPDGALVFTSTATTAQLADVVRKLTDSTYEYRMSGGGRMRFDAAGRLTAMIDRNNNITTLAYTGANLTSITDPVNRSITLAYDGANRIKSATDPLGRVWTYAYNGVASLTSVTDPLGNLTRYTYDAPGRLRTVIDKRGTTVKQITYDNGRVSQQVFADGGIEHYAYTLTGNAVTATTITDSLGRTRTLRFNSAGYVIEMTDALGQSSVIERDMATSLPVRTAGPCGCAEATREFDARGNLTAITDRLGHTERYEYEPVFNNITRVTDKLNRVTNFGYDASGNLTTATDALNQTTVYAYDGLGRLTSVTDPLNHTSRLQYDNDSNLTAMIDALNHQTTLEYDGIGRLTATVDPLGRRTTMTYDGLDRIVTLTDPAATTTRYLYDPNGNLLRVTNGLNQRWLRTYDAKNRLAFTTDPLSRVSRFQYDTEDQMLAAISASGRATRYAYDPRGQVATITNPLGGTIRFTYDNKGNLATLTDERGNLTSFAYDELYRLASRRDPVGQTTTFGYDAASNLTEKIDRLGRRTNLTYDGLNRPLKLAYADALVIYTYDAANRLMRIDDSQSGSIQRSYDDANRLLTETTPTGVVSYDYNDANQRISMTAADRPPVTYGYDTAGRLQTIAQGPEAFTYAYDALSRLASLQRPNGVMTTYGYDALNRLARLTHNGAQSQPLEDYQYGYNADDEIISLSSLASAQTLTSAKSVSVASAANRIAQFGPSSFSFDTEGQTIAKAEGQGATAYDWDARGRMSRATLPNGQAISYSYDALGRRVSRTAGGITTRFLYDGQDVTLDRSSDGSAVDYLNGLGIDDKLRQSSAATGPLYFLQDHLGSTAALTNAGGNVVERMQYEAFGNSASSTLTRYGFTGRERDSLTGLLYYRARWQDPQQGRFISEDPIAPTRALNHYSYVSNNPLVFRDPTGFVKAFSIGISGTIGGSLFPFFAPGIFIGGGTNLGFTSTGQVFVQFQASALIGQGIFAGVGFQGGASNLSCPLPVGISTENAVHAEANIGLVKSSGAAIDINRSSQSLALPVMAKRGAGIGLMVGAGISTTTTIASKPINQIYNDLVNAGAGFLQQVFGGIVDPANYSGEWFGSDH